MTATTHVKLVCDGPSLGLACSHEPAWSTATQIELRARLRAQGWTRRPDASGPRMVDLCPDCTPAATHLLPPPPPGRYPGRPRRKVPL